jgi:hypothetical protein
VPARLPSRRLLAAAGGLLATLLFLWLAASAPATADDYEERRQEGRCYCHRGQATWDYLRSPLVPPADPPHCGLMIGGGSCKSRPRPPGTSGTCWGSQKESCFWKRHAFSWDIRCSVCWSDETCSACDGLIHERDALTRALLAKRIASESKTFGPNVVVAASPHFYVVTAADKRIKVVTKRGSKRLMSAHEVVHLYAQRCEIAYADFMHWFGGDVNLHKPMAVYITDEESTRKAVGTRYFGGEGIHMNYAFAYNDRIADGFSGNGFVVGLQHQGDDHNMHGYCRHQIGHILFSCWQVHGGFEEECPRWAWVGAAHFLEKLHPFHADYACYCYGEGAGGEGPTKKWPKRVRALAAGRREPIETFFNKNSLSAMKYPDHLRAWSIMDLMLREDRTRWLETLARLRTREHEGKAFKEVLGLTPDAFDVRWGERVLGRRKTMGAVRADNASDEEPGRRERRRLETTQDAEELAGLVRGLDEVKDLATLESVLTRMGDKSDLVRESIHLVLLRTRMPALRAVLREQALHDSDSDVRAGVARVLGGLRDAEARVRLEAALDDRAWEVRSEAAGALERIGDAACVPVLVAHLGEKQPKAWIAIADALAALSPERLTEATLPLAQRLDDPRWQVRLTAARALAAVGTEACLDLLIERFAKENGRLKKEFHAALRGVTGDDLGPRAATWATWWKTQKDLHGGLPPAPPEPVAPTPGETRYADPNEGKRPEDDPHYYGRRVYSRSVCFVLDTSGSMELNMKVRPEDTRRLGDLPSQGTRDEIAKKALRDALYKLDPRTKVRLVFFGSRVKLWKNDLQPATPANVAAAEDALRNARPEGETNFHGALKAALGLHEKATTTARLEDIPDTVYFLTDGRPTDGEITSMPELVSWFAHLNRFAKVELHIIALGELNVDLPSLEALAQAGNGVLVHVREP